MDGGLAMLDERLARPDGGLVWSGEGSVWSGEGSAFDMEGVAGSFEWKNKPSSRTDRAISRSNNGDNGYPNVLYRYFLIALYSSGTISFVYSDFDWKIATD